MVAGGSNNSGFPTHQRAEGLHDSDSPALAGVLERVPSLLLSQVLFAPEICLGNPVRGVGATGTASIYAQLCRRNVLKNAKSGS